VYSLGEGCSGGLCCHENDDLNPEFVVNSGVTWAMKVLRGKHIIIIEAFIVKEVVHNPFKAFLVKDVV